MDFCRKYLHSWYRDSKTRLRIGGYSVDVGAPNCRSPFVVLAHKDSEVNHADDRVQMDRWRGSEKVTI